VSDGGDQRRLSAILAADVAGYTRLMEQDTDGTVTAWKAARADVIDPAITNHSGRIVKHTGDGFLAEFNSVQDAVECALEMQEMLESSPLDFRMGVNLGDVLDDGVDIHGEGVNVAARIEGIAEVGGICISASVHEQVRHRLDYPFEDLGEIEVKNVSDPVHVIRILIGADAVTKPRRRRRGKNNRMAAAALLLAVIVAVIGWWVLEGTHIRHEAPQQKVAMQRGERSIAVLPFDNLSNDPEQEYFSDGMTEDLITDLSRLTGFFVIARNTSFAYKGKSINLQDVGRELGVRYILEGSVRKVGNEVRINTQLIDSTTGGHIWAQRYDGPLDNVFKLQDKITGEIVTALAQQLGTSDPATASSIFLTTATDVVSMGLLLGFATIFLL